MWSFSGTSPEAKTFHEAINHSSSVLDFAGELSLCFHFCKPFALSARRFPCHLLLAHLILSLFSSTSLSTGFTVPAALVFFGHHSLGRIPISTFLGFLIIPLYSEHSNLLHLWDNLQYVPLTPHVQYMLSHFFSAHCLCSPIISLFLPLSRISPRGKKIRFLTSIN